MGGRQSTPSAGKACAGRVDLQVRSDSASRKGFLGQDAQSQRGMHVVFEIAFSVVSGGFS